MIVADLHLHSKYSRAVSRDMELATMAHYASKKGINLLTTGDWTHPLWLREIKTNLKESEEGGFVLKSQDPSVRQAQDKNSKSQTKFILSVEVSSIYSQGGKTRRIHNLIFSPSIETSEKINKELVKRGANLNSDGRPIMGIPSITLLEIVGAIDKKAFIIPCHAWTPWFSIFGSMSGFDSIEECFGELSSEIFAIETGLSSDPSMNWRIKELNNRSIVSFSDAHSPMKMGREATVFVSKDGNPKSKTTNPKFDYDDIRMALMQDKKSKFKIGYTIEFYPEEGKYHYSGHRNCKVIQSPSETKKNGAICPVCKKPLTLGVMHRVEELAAEDEKYEPKQNEMGLRWIIDPKRIRPPYVKLVPLNEIIAEAIGNLVGSNKVKQIYEDLVEAFGSEFEVLLKSEIAEIEKKVGPDIALAVNKVRKGDIVIRPGFDGEYGVVKINLNDKMANSDNEKIVASSQSQLGLDF